MTLVCHVYLEQGVIIGRLNNQRQPKETGASLLRPAIPLYILLGVSLAVCNVVKHLCASEYQKKAEMIRLKTSSNYFSTLQFKVCRLINLGTFNTIQKLGFLEYNSVVSLPHYNIQIFKI